MLGGQGPVLKSVVTYGSATTAAPMEFDGKGDETVCIQPSRYACLSLRCVTPTQNSRQVRWSSRGSLRCKDADEYGAYIANFFVN